MTLAEFRQTREALTPAERRVFDQLLESGDEIKDIARRLGCAAGTVKQHMRRIFDRFHTRSRPGLMALALRAYREAYSLHEHA